MNFIKFQFFQRALFSAKTPILKIFLNLIQKFKHWYIDYKLENAIYKQFEKPKPQWEHYLGFVITIFLLLRVFNFLLPENLQDIITLLFILATFVFTLYMGVETKRGFNSIRTYYKYRKPQTANFTVQKRFIFTSTVFLKIIKPTVKACFYCLGGTVTATGAFDYCNGFNPMREITLTQDGLQTWDQAWHHITNPSEYRNSEQLPYLQDKEKTIEQQKLIIEKLNKQIDQISKK